MERLNRYYRCSKIRERKTRRIIRYFAHDLTASKTAELVGLTRRTATVIFGKIRQRIAQACERASPFAGEVEVDESYFGARRVRGKRGRGASGKTIVFGIFKETVRSIPRLSRIARNARCSGSFAVMSRSIL
jgi:transposase-like protein